MCDFTVISEDYLSLIRSCGVKTSLMGTLHSVPAGPVEAVVRVRWDKIDYPDTDQWGSFKAQQKLHFKAFFHAVY